MNIGIIYCTIAPLTLVLSLIAFALFLLVFRYNILYVITSRFETDGLLYIKAPEQLFVGIYVMEIYCLGLFALVRDDMGRFVCPGQVGSMTVILRITVLFQCFLHRSYHPLTRQVPNNAPQDNSWTENADVLPEEDNATVQEHGQNGFTDDSLKARTPIIWLPGDPTGMNARALGVGGQGITTTTDKAFISSNGKISTTGIPSYMDSHDFRT